MGGSVQPYGKRWRIVIYWKGGHRRLSVDCDTFQPFFTKARGEKYLGVAQQQIDREELDPANWQADSPVLVERKAPAWLISAGRRVSKKTLQMYSTAVYKYIIPLIGKKDVRKLKHGDMQDLYDLLLDRHTNEIGYKVMSTLRTMLRDLYRREDIFRVPPFPVLTRSSEKKVVEYLTLEQQDKLLDAIPERHRPIFEFGMEFGLRTQEVRAIQWDCIKDGRVLIKRAFSENALKGTKTGDERSLILTTNGRRILDNAKQNTSVSYVFVRPDGKPYTNKNINATWRGAEKTAGIYCKLQNAMRHSLACQLLDKGVPIETVMQILGHKTIKMTMRYTHRMITPSADSALENRRVVKINEKHVDFVLKV